MENLRRKEHHTSTMTAEAGGPTVGTGLRHLVEAVGRGCTLRRPDGALLSGPPILPAVSSDRLGWSW